MSPLRRDVFLRIDEEEMTASDWVSLGGQAVDEKRDTDALAYYQRASAMGDVQGLTNLGWCFEAGVGVEADPKQAVVLYAQAATREYVPALTNLGVLLYIRHQVEKDLAKALECFRKERWNRDFPGHSSCWQRLTGRARAWSRVMSKR